MKIKRRKKEIAIAIFFIDIIKQSNMFTHLCTMFNTSCDYLCGSPYIATFILKI